MRYPRKNWVEAAALRAWIFPAGGTQDIRDYQINGGITYTVEVKVIEVIGVTQVHKCVCKRRSIVLRGSHL